jgi:hypothetical protein
MPIKMWILAPAIAAGMLVLPGCSEDPPSKPPDSTTVTGESPYFPPFRLNQTIYWSYHQATNRLSPVLCLDGVMRWDVQSIDSTVNTTSVLIRRVFSGTRSGNFWGPRPGDTAYIAADTSFFMIRKTRDTVVVELNGQGQFITYKGHNPRFVIPPPTEESAEVTLTDWMPSLTYVVLKRDAGLVQLYSGYGSNSQDQYNYSRLDPNAVPSMESDNYFPQPRTGDSTAWDFRQTYHTSTTEQTIWEGVLVWRVMGEGGNENARSFQVEREFTGRRIEIAGTIDTTIITGAKDLFVLSDSGRTVRIPFEGSGSGITYYGEPLTFERIIPIRYGDEVRFSQNRWSHATFRRGEEILRMEGWRMQNVTSPSYEFTYTRRK